MKTFYLGVLQYFINCHQSSINHLHPVTPMSLHHVSKSPPRLWIDHSQCHVTVSHHYTQVHRNSLSVTQRCPCVFSRVCRFLLHRSHITVLHHHKLSHPSIDLTSDTHMIKSPPLEVVIQSLFHHFHDHSVMSLLTHSTSVKTWKCWRGEQKVTRECGNSPERTWSESGCPGHVGVWSWGR